MALSSDEIIKREIIDTVGYKQGDMQLRVFPEGSRDDQKLYTEGGLTFSHNGVDYGSCDAGWFINGTKPVIALEGTDALNRKSSGNAQYQRFHHALGAVKNGLIGIYYLKKGIDKIQPDLYGMAYFASMQEEGYYLIVDDLSTVKELLELIDKYEYPSTQVADYLNKYLQKMYDKWYESFDKKYKGSWKKFCERRSTIALDNHTIVKYAGRMKRNFTDSSQRAGHIALGEMYLTKCFFYYNDESNKQLGTNIDTVYYLFLKTTQDDLAYLDIHKMNDKEWYILRHEPNVIIKTIDDLNGLSDEVKSALIDIKEKPLKDEALKTFNACVKIIRKGLENGSITIR